MTHLIVWLFAWRDYLFAVGVVVICVEFCWPLKSRLSQVICVFNLCSINTWCSLWRSKIGWVVWLATSGAGRRQRLVTITSTHVARILSISVWLRHVLHLARWCSVPVAAPAIWFMVDMKGRIIVAGELLLLLFKLAILLGIHICKYKLNKKLFTVALLYTFTAKYNKCY